VRDILIDALIKKYEAEIAENTATLNIYLTNPVGIGEHPQHIEEMDKIIHKIGEAKDKLSIIKNI
jgi:glycine cleavage system protein P-like pyridoxal-binding family|tara:strand:- start:290 stop:484 length:195 start_codon:yes stop_codon:yes gene_type:complete